MNLLLYKTYYKSYYMLISIKYLYQIFFISIKRYLRVYTYII